MSDYVEISPEILKKAHACMVEILKEIDRICTKHQITWFLFAGTALGAIRHQGFIPWDDDCDVAMPRKDYEKFLEIAGKELPDNLFLQTKKTDPAYGRPMVKVRMNGTKLVEHRENLEEKYNQGIFVDVFPYDFYPNFVVYFGRLFNVMPKLRQKRKRYPRGDWRRTFVGVLTAVPYAIHSLFFKLFAFICRWCSDSAAPLIGVELRMNDNLFYRVQDVLPTRKDMVFEGYYFPMVANPDACLRLHYGDYMQLPPVDERHTHAKLIEC